MFPVKRIFLLSCLLLFCAKSRAGSFDDNCGIGVVNVEVYNFFSLEFYSKPNEIISDDGIYFYYDTIKPALKYKFSSTGSSEIPYWFNPQTFIFTKEKRKLQFFCVEKRNDWCKIVTNKELGNTAWVELGFDVTFSEWQTFFPTVSKIEVVKGDSLLFDNPLENSISTSLNLNSDHNYIQVIHCKNVQANWMNIEIDELDEFGKIINTRNGWIKWRNENEMLIRYFV